MEKIVYLNTQFYVRFMALKRGEALSSKKYDFSRQHRWFKHNILDADKVLFAIHVSLSNYYPERSNHT